MCWKSSGLGVRGCRFELALPLIFGSVPLGQITLPPRLHSLSLQNKAKYPGSSLQGHRDVQENLGCKVLTKCRVS